MSNWNSFDNKPSALNWQFGDIERRGTILYPDLQDGSDLVLASDYSGEHAQPEFHVFSFLVTTYAAVLQTWEPLRQAVRCKHLSDGRRMSFKCLNEASRINALPSFLEAASQLNGLLVCVGVDKTYSLSVGQLPTLGHSWKPDSLKKLLEICVFGGGFVDGLRRSGQNLHWITDDDAIVANDEARFDAVNVMGGLMHKHDDEYLEISIGVSSQFDDEKRAEDLVAITDLAAGAYSDELTKMGKANIPTPESVPTKVRFPFRMKSALITAWRSLKTKPLKHLDLLIRYAGSGETLISFGSPGLKYQRDLRALNEEPAVYEKWRRSLMNHSKQSRKRPGT